MGRSQWRRSREEPERLREGVEVKGSKEKGREQRGWEEKGGRLQPAEPCGCLVAGASARPMRTALPQRGSRGGCPALDFGDFRTRGGWVGADFPTS